MKMPAESMTGQFVLYKSSWKQAKFCISVNQNSVCQLLSKQHKYNRSLTDFGYISFQKIDLVNAQHKLLQS